MDHLKSLYGNLLHISSIFTFCFLAPRHVGSQFTEQGLNRNPGTGRWILNHWTTGEVQEFSSISVFAGGEGRQVSPAPALLPGSPAWVSKSPRAYSLPHLGSSPCTRPWGQMASFSCRSLWHGSQIGVFQFFLLPGAECSSVPAAHACCSGLEPSAAAGHRPHFCLCGSQSLT